MLHFFFFLILFLLPCSSCWVLGFWEASPLCVARIFRCQLRYSLLHLAVVHLKTTGKFCFVFEFHGHSGARWPLPVTTTKANNDWAISYVVSHCSKIDNRSTSPHPGLVLFLRFSTTVSAIVTLYKRFCLRYRLHKRASSTYCSTYHNRYLVIL